MGHMDNYVEVKDRIVQFYKAFPEGSLRCKEWTVTEVAGQAYFVYVAQAFRTQDDQAPAEGIAWEPVPGTTNFTRGSEAQNCETSAWGRAIVALGISADKGIASANEVRNQQSRHDPTPQQTAEVRAHHDKRKSLADVLTQRFSGDMTAARQWVQHETGKDATADLTLAEMDALIKEMGS